MIDIVDSPTRSRMMAGIKPKNTNIEMIIREGLHSRGFRYLLHPDRMPGKPDIVMPKWRVAIFVHGCFWHLHRCSLSKIPTTNRVFWESKFAANQRRDKLAQLQLAANGWRTITIWKCATRGKIARTNLSIMLDNLANWIRDQEQPSSLEIPPSAMPLAVEITTH